MGRFCVSQTHCSLKGEKSTSLPEFCLTRISVHLHTFNGDGVEDADVQCPQPHSSFAAKGWTWNPAVLGCGDIARVACEAEDRENALCMSCYEVTLPFCRKLCAGKREAQDVLKVISIACKLLRVASLLKMQSLCAV